MNLSFRSLVDGEFIQFSVPFSPGESVYEIAQREGIKVPVACRNGVCEICRAQLVSGSVLSGAQKKPISVDKRSDSQQIMMCQTWPQNNCELEVKNILKPGELPLKKINCQVTTVELIKGNVYQVEMLLPAGKPPEFYAGQYLAVQIPGKDAPCYYSIASRPGIRELRLHIQADPHLQSAVEVIDHLRSSKESGQCVSVEMPMGKACLSKASAKRLILVAAGTGFAQMTSIIEHAFSENFDLPIDLYWGVRKEEDMYLRATAEQWEREHDNFTFHPLVADIENIAENAHHNQLSDAVLKDFENVENALVFVSGSPKLVFSAMDALLEAGLKEEFFFSDVLEYASR